MNTTPRIDIKVQTADFDLAQCYAQVCAGDRSIGAVAAFVGRVRDLNLAQDVVALELEHYPGMTEKSLSNIANLACLRWPLQAITIIHRVGRLYPCDQIVLVLTASGHRHAAYEANSFIMDYLKTQAPFWKKEWTPEGPRWIEARDCDASAAARWHEVVSQQYGNHDHD